MAKRAKSSKKKPIEQYEHKGKKRMNNPPVGLVDTKTDAPEGKKTYAYDPHLDPQLQWAGKVERTSFEIPTVSLHVHERIDPRSILEAVRKKNGSGAEQISLFSSPTEKTSRRSHPQSVKLDLARRVGRERKSGNQNRAEKRSLPRSKEPHGIPPVANEFDHDRHFLTLWEAAIEHLIDVDCQSDTYAKVNCVQRPIGKHHARSVVTMAFRTADLGVPSTSI
jgi:hypothetical protein